MIACWLLGAATGQLHAQDVVVHGKVTDGADKRGLPGVSVSLKGTNQGTITGADGNYSIQVPTRTSVLVFSFMGMTSVEETVGQRGLIDVELIEDTRQLSEIVVTGSGVPVEKRKLAYAVEAVKGDNLPRAPTASIDQALIGRIPGALISVGNGSPGSDASILLRGINSINRGTQPMILVNGVEMKSTNLNSLDLSTVERVEVVQGAAAASIYGAQGANGVIQIFTKQGKRGNLAIDISSSVSSNEWLNVGGVAKSALHAFKTDSAGNVIGLSGKPIVQSKENLIWSENVVWDQLDSFLITNKPYTGNLSYHNHLNEFYQTALTFNNSLSISGGSEDVDYNFSFSNNHQASNFRGDGFNDRSNFLTNIGVDLTPKLKLRSISQFVYTRNTVIIWNKQDFSPNGLIFGMLEARPFSDYFATDSVRNYGLAYGPASGANQFNPNYTFQYANTSDIRSDFMQSLELNYAPTKVIELSLKYGLNTQTRTVKYEAANQSLNANSNYTGGFEGWNAIDNTGERSKWEYERTSQNLLAMGTIRLDLERDFNLQFPLLTSTQVAFDYRSYDSYDFETYGLGMPLLPPNSASQASTFKIDKDITTRFVTFGYLLNQRFEWKDRVGFSGGFRTDYSSAFGKGSTPFTFPRGDVYVRVSAFDFWNEAGLSKFILDWKLRAAYGQAGIQPQPFDRYPTLASRTIGASNTYYLDAQQANPNLNVEVSTEFEVGTDISFEGSKGNWLKKSILSFTYWNRRTDNAISTIDAPPSSGVGSLIDNAFSISSHGIQASWTSTLLSSRNLQWNFTVNFGTQASIIQSIKNNAEIVLGSYVLKAGEKVGQLTGYLLLNNLEATNSEGQQFIPKDSVKFFEVASNGWVVDKRTKRPYITTDKYPLGDPFPDFNASVINDYSFKKVLSFGFQIDWVHGGNIFNNTKNLMYFKGVHSDYEKEITINGATGAWTAFYYGVYNGTAAAAPKNYFMEDGSFVRLRNVYIGLDLAQVFKIRLRKLQLVLSGRNLFTWTKYSGMDPEISAYNPSGVLMQRWDDHVLPNFRSYQVTLNIGF